MIFYLDNNFQLVFMILQLNKLSKTFLNLAENDCEIS